MLRHAGRRAARFAAALAATILLPASPVVADNGLRIEGDTTYEVVPSQGLTTVSSTVTVTNETTDRVVSGSLRRLFFNGVSVGVVAGARNFTAISSGANLAVSTEAVSEEVQRVGISFPSLFSGQRRTIALRYEIAGDAPRAQGLSRANPAYVSFIALSIGDDTLATVRVNVPPGFEVETVGARVDKSRRGDGGTALSASSFATSNGWAVVVSARNDAALTSVDADVGTRDVVVRAWPNDADWQRFVVTGVTEGIPVLEELIGRPWPIDSQLQITEATSSYLRGYAGWFSPSDKTIEVGEDLDYETLLHELSHAWFNRELFTDRWINEGFAEEYAAQALKKLGKPTDDVALDTNSKYAVRLVDWANPSSATGDAAAREAYGYHTSAWVIRQLTDEIGLANMANVVRAVADNTPSYGGTPNEFGDIETTTTRLLDLLEDVGGSKKASDLFEKYVTRESLASLYDTRLSSRERYTELVAKGGEWTAPVVVRNELGAWHFAAADQRMTEALTVLEKREQIRRRSEQAGATPPTSLESEYEKAATDLSVAATTAERQLAAATTLAQTKDRVDESRSITEKVGLLFAQPGRKLDRARDAFTADDTTQATTLSLAAQREIDDAATAGLRRLAIGAGVLLLLIGATFAIRHVRGRGDRGATPPPSFPPPPPPPPPPPSWFPLSS